MFLVCDCIISISVLFIVDVSLYQCIFIYPVKKEREREREREKVVYVKSDIKIWYKVRMTTVK